MKIHPLNTITFERRLKPSEEEGYIATLKEGKKAIGNTGYSMLIVPQQSLPQSMERNTGVGNLLSKDGQEFIDFAKKYWGINTVQILPIGEKFKHKGAYFPYSGSAFSLSPHCIDIEKLATSDYGNLLNKNDIENVVKANNRPDRDIRVNYENVYDNESPMEKTLQRAYENLMKKDTLQKEKLLTEFEEYKIKNKEWLEPKSIFNGLTKEYSKSNYKKWSDIDMNLYNDSVVPIETKLKRIQELQSKYALDIDIYSFEQFLAEKHLKEAKTILNSKGIELSGDMLSNFSGDEVWANPKAFIKDSSVGYGAPALDFGNSEGKELLRKKVNRFANLYDDIRVDYAWAYCDQPIYDLGKCLQERRHYKGEILDIIENEFKKVKGEQFKPEKITYEFIADRSLFNVFEGDKIKPYLENRTKIYCSNNMTDNWVTTDAFKKRGWSDKSYILGATNHDCKAMKIDYLDLAKKTRETEILSKILKVPKEQLKDVNDFINAKFAEPMSSKHNMFFFLDALNLDGQYKDNPDKALDYRIKIPEKYQDKYFQSLERMEGYNPMDALEKNFVAKGLDKSNPELYKKIVKYRDILQSQKSKNAKNKFKTAGKITAIIAAGVLLGLGCYYIINSSTQNKTSD